MEYSETSVHILETARKMFALHGFKAVTTRELARECGLSEVTLFRHFGNKNLLFEKVLQYFITKPRYENFIDTEAEELEKYLRGVGKLIHTVFIENLDLFRIELIERQRIKSMNFINNFPNEIKEQIQSFIIKKKMVPEKKAATFAICFMTSVHGLCMNLYFLDTFKTALEFSECLEFIIEKYV